MKLKLNKEYARRHLFVTLLMAGLSCWFGYDGFVRYPSLSAADLYRSIEKSDPPAEINLEAFKKQKTQTQYGFTVITLIIALIVGFRLRKSSKFDFEFDENGFTCEGRTFTKADIASIDRSAWEKKSILVLKLKDGKKIVLDAWHHAGVKEFDAAYRL